MEREKDVDGLIRWLRTFCATSVDPLLIDERRTVPPHVILEFGRAGLFGLQASESDGGLGLTHLECIRIYQQLSAFDLTLATQVSSHANCVYLVDRFASTPARLRWLEPLATGRTLGAFALTEPDTGSNPHGIRSEASGLDGGRWRLRGEKYLVDTAAWAGVIAVFACTLQAGADTGTMSGFLIPRQLPGVKIGAEALTLGLRGMVQNSLSFEDVELPADALLGAAGTGYAMVQATLSIARFNLAAKCVGASKRCLQPADRFSRRRSIASGPMRENSVVRTRLVELIALMSAADRLVEALARSLDERTEVPHEVYLGVKVAASEMLWEVVVAVSQLLGGRGYEEANIVARYLRDARSFLLSEGATEPLLSMIGARATEGEHSVQGFIRRNLDGSDLSRELERSAQGLRDRFGRDGRSDVDWMNFLVGRLACNALLGAALRQGAATDLERSWSARIWLAGVADAEQAAERWANPSVAADIDTLMARISREIGQADPPSLVENRLLDPLLRSGRAFPSKADTALGWAAQPDLAPQRPRIEPHAGWNRTGTPLDDDTSIVRVFQRRAGEGPERVAVRSSNDSLTYRQLDERSDQMAALLRDNGAAPGTLIAVGGDRNVQWLVSLLGVLKLGAVYVPIDLKQPVRRLERLLGRSRIDFLVVDESATVPTALAHKSLRVDPRQLAGMSCVVAGLPTADQTAYIMHTSGSTGQPKAVAVSHSSLRNLLGSMIASPGLGPTDTLLAITPFTFDISLLDLLGPLAAGGTVAIADWIEATDPRRLAGALERVGATVLQATPATWMMLLESGWTGAPGLRAWCGGDRLPDSLAKRLLDRLPELWNLYGPTETTIWSTITRLRRGEPVTIGLPISGTGVYLLDEFRRPVADGVTGEIWISGAGVAQAIGTTLRSPQAGLSQTLSSRAGGCTEPGILVRGLPMARFAIPVASTIRSRYTDTGLSPVKSSLHWRSIPPSSRQSPRSTSRPARRACSRRLRDCGTGPTAPRRISASSSASIFLPICALRWYISSTRYR